MTLSWLFNQTISVQHLSKGISGTGLRQTAWGAPFYIRCKIVARETQVKDMLLGRAAKPIFKVTYSAGDVQEGDRVLWQGKFYIVREIQDNTILQAGPGASFKVFEMQFDNLAPPPEAC